MGPVTDALDFIQWLATLSPAQIQAAYRRRKEIGDLLQNHAIEDGRVTSHFASLDLGMILALLEREGFRTPQQKEDVRHFVTSILQLTSPYNSTLCYRVYHGFNLFEQGMGHAGHDPESFRDHKKLGASWDSTPSALVFWAPMWLGCADEAAQIISSLPRLGQYRFEAPSASLAIGLSQAHQTRTGYRWPSHWTLTVDGDGFGESLCYRYNDQNKIELEMIDLHPAARPPEIHISPVLIVPITGG